MGAKLCTSKANRKCKENHGKYNGNKKKGSNYNPIQNTLKKPIPHLHSDDDGDDCYKSASIHASNHKRINNNNYGSNIKLTPYSSVDTMTDAQIPLYEQLNDSIINRNNSNIRLTLDVAIDQTANTNDNDNDNAPLDSGFVMLAEPSNDYLTNPVFPSFAKSNTSICSSSFHLSSPTNNIVSTDNKQDDDDDEEDEDDTMIDEDEVYIPPQHKMTIGDEIELSVDYNSLHGVIKFIGELIGKKGIWYGLQLNRPKGSDDVTYWKNQSNIHNKLRSNSESDNDHPRLIQTVSNRPKGHKCDGCYDGYCYFKCDSNEGLFVKETQIARILIVNYNNPRIAINQEIYVKKYDSKGIIKYIGKPEYENDENIHETYYGIKLLSQSNDISITEENNGIFHDRRYFTDPDPVGHCIFVMSSDLSQYVVPSRYNLLCHGYFQCKTNIPPGINLQCYLQCTFFWFNHFNIIFK